MRFLIEGRLRPSCGLSPAEYFDLAVREWEMVLGWLSSGVALAYGRPVSLPGGTLLVDVSSEGDARALAASLPLAPYADVTVRRSDLPAARPFTPAPATAFHALKRPSGPGTGCREYRLEDGGVTPARASDYVSDVSVCKVSPLSAASTE